MKCGKEDLSRCTDEGEDAKEGEDVEGEEGRDSTTP